MNTNGSKLDDETIDRYNLGYRPLGDGWGWQRETDSYTIPYSQDGKLINIRHRLGKEIGGKYRPEFAGIPNAIFNADRLAKSFDVYRNPDELIIVEGEIKAMVLDQVGFRVIAIPGATSWPRLIDDIQRDLKPFSRIFIALDPGAETQARALAVAIGTKAIVSCLSGKPDDMLVIDGIEPGELYKQLALTMAKSRDERNRVLALAKASKERLQAMSDERKAEIDRRFEAGNVTPFMGDEVNPEHVEYLREQFTNAAKWSEYVAETWPDIDAEEQQKIKLAENREARPGKCGEWRKVVLPSGKVESKRWTCGICKNCKKRGAWIYRKALNQIQGIPDYNFTSPLEGEAPRENASPLSEIKGDITFITVYSDEERLSLGRTLGRSGTNYRCQPLDLNGELAYDFIINDDRGEMLMLLNDDRLAGWVAGYEGKRSSGSMLPSLNKLQQRYRQALDFEVVMPEMDDDNLPVDEDMFFLELPDIGTTAKLPDIAIDFIVHDQETLQKALFEINYEQLTILSRQKRVDYGVYTKKKFYTRYSTLDQMIGEFNERQAEIRKKKGLPDLE